MAPLPFFILAVISRGIMGLGNNMAFTAMFAIIFQEFSERAITVISLSETLAGLMVMVTPLIGGGLYDVCMLFLNLILLCNLKQFEFMFDNSFEFGKISMSITWKDIFNFKSCVIKIEVFLLLEMKTFKGFSLDTRLLLF